MDGDDCRSALKNKVCFFFFFNRDSKKKGGSEQQQQQRNVCDRVVCHRRPTTRNIVLHVEEPVPCCTRRRALLPRAGVRQKKSISNATRPADSTRRSIEIGRRKRRYVVGFSVESSVRFSVTVPKITFRLSAQTWIHRNTKCTKNRLHFYFPSTMRSAVATPAQSSISPR